MFPVEKRGFERLRWRAVSAALGGFLWVGIMMEVEAAQNTVSATAGAESGTRAMVARLVDIARDTDPLEVRFLSAAQVPRLRALMEVQPALAMDAAFRFRLAEAMMNASMNAEARREWEVVEQLSRRPDAVVTRGTRENLLLNRALTELREGEVLNCQSNHNADSCLLPIAGGGVHRWQEPSRRALRMLESMLVETPDHLGARWLLNIAAMTVGEYPHAVDARWLIPASAFASEAPFPRFREVAPAIGLAINDISGGSVVDDFDGDGLLDVAVTSIGLSDPMHLLRNLGNGRFGDRSEAAGLVGLTGGLNLVQADYDNDGDLDLFVLRGAWMGEQGRHPNSLLRNRGDGRFDDVTEAAGVFSQRPTQTAVWFDFDGDGWLDLFVGNESTAGKSRHPNELYHNQRDGTFREIGALSGVSALGYVKGVAAGDYNKDGRPDLYLSILGGRNRLYRNDGPKGTNVLTAGWKFTDVATTAGVTEPFWSFPCWFFDYDNDGWQDLWVSGYRISGVGDVAADYLGLPHEGVRPRLYRNQGDGTFCDVTVELGLNRLVHAMGSNFGDLDNDGWLDFYAGTGDPDLLTLMPNRMFRNEGGKRFRDVSSAGGFGHLQKGHGVAFADLDNDGDQDVHENMGGAVSGDVYPDVVFENPGFSGHHWLKLQLEGRRANRSAIGASVRVEIEGPEGSRSVYRVVSSGGSFGGNPLRMEIGLGAATQIKSVEIQWPGSGTVQTVEGMSMDRCYRIREEEAAAELQALKRVQFPAGPGGHAGHTGGLR